MGRINLCAECQQCPPVNEQELTSREFCLNSSANKPQKMNSPLLDELLRVATESGASDLILHFGKPAMVRIDGKLTALEAPPISNADLDDLWERMGASKTDLDRDGSLTSPGGTRFRVNLLHQLGTRAAVLRRIRSVIPDIDSLGVPGELVRDWVARPSGIIIISGPTGSGKSTTVAASLEWINQTQRRHIVTIEDPVEYLFEAKSSLFTQREVGIDTPSFAEGLRRSLRQAPDVIFLGEIRGALSAVTAIQAAETGHLVFATLHSSTCADTVDRLQLLFPQGEREAVRKTLASQLLGIFCQRLVPSTDGTRALLCEYFSNAASSRKIIAEGRMPDLVDFITRADPLTARSFGESLFRLVKDGRVDPATALEISDNPQELSRMLRGISSSTQAHRR